MLVLLVLGLIAFPFLYYYLNKWYRSSLLNDLGKKAVFITGTDTGFGRELALSLDEKGVKVYAGCYTENGAVNLRQSASSRMNVFQIDVSRVDSIKRAKEHIESDPELPPEGLWGIVNNAGIQRGFLIGLTTVDDFQEVFNVNFFGVLNVNEIFIPLVKKSQGRIVNVMSILGRATGAAEPYLSSKAALVPYNDGLRRWMRLFNVHVAAIEPGYFRTEITKASFLIGDLYRTWNRLPADLKEEYGGEGFIKKLEKEFLYWIDNFPLSHLNKTPVVIDAITHALFAKHPKCRYVLGLDAHLLFRSTQFLPDWLIDYGVKIFFPSVNIIRRNVLKQRAMINGNVH